MVEDRLTGKDLRSLLVWIALGIAGALFAFKFFFAAFPEASVDFRISRPAAQAKARAFVTQAGEDIHGYESTIVFAVDDNAKTYLEREVGLAEANRLMAGEVSVWYWDVRFFRPLQEEEFRVRVSPAGRITGYEHKIEEARAGARLDRAAALEKAQQFLRARYGADLAEWGFLESEAGSTERPKRLDWNFAWERRNFRAKDAPYRLNVTVNGDHIGEIEEKLKVPEAWERSYARLRSSNIFYNQVAILPYAFLIGAALWLGFTFTRRGRVTWGGALKLGLFVAVLLLMMQLNEWPLTRSTYKTNDSYSSFVARKLAIALLFAMGSALMVLVVLPAGEALYRSSWPERVRLGRAFSSKGIRSKEFFCASVVGVSMAAAHIGFVVAFYLVGRSFGVWAPQDVDYTNAVSTAFPWIAGVAIGMLAATSEEFLFRLFAIPFLQRLTKSRILALILPAFAWGFLHSAYPQEPGYIRGIEVGIIGVVAGLVMLRWGIVATLIWHYTVDALLISLFLLRSENLYFRVSGAIVGAAALVPLAVSGISYLVRGRFEAEESLLNRAAPLPEETPRAALPKPAAVPSFHEGAPLEEALQIKAQEPATTQAVRYDGLSVGKIGLLGACLILGGALLATVKPEQVGDYLRLSVDARAAKARADALLRQRGLKPESYRSATTLIDRTDNIASEFLRRRIGIAGVNHIYDTEVPGALWRVRYFRDAQKEEYAVILKPDGSLHAVRHELDEAAPGASLTKEQAQARAEAYLLESKMMNLGGWKLVGAESKKQPKRTDHTFTWEEIRPLDVPPGSAATGDPAEHAHARVEVQVLGDEPTSYRTYIKISDEWRRKQEEGTLSRTLVLIGRIVLFVALGLAALIIYLRNLRTVAAGSVPWKRLARWAAWGVMGFALAFVLGNRLPLLLAQYDTAVPYKFLIGVVVISFLLGAGFYFALLVMVDGVAWFYGVQAFGEDRLTGWLRMPRRYYRDALFIGLGGTGAFLALGRLTYLLEKIWSTPHRALEAAIGQDFDAYLPAAQVLGGAVTRGLLITGVIALAAAFVATRLRARWMRIALFLLIALAFIGDWGNGADFAKQLLARIVVLAVVWWGTAQVVRFNLLGYFLVVSLTAILGAAARLREQPAAFYRANALALYVAATLLLLWPLVEWRRRTNSA